MSATAHIQNKRSKGETGGSEEICIKDNDASLKNLYSDLRNSCYRTRNHKNTTRPRLIKSLKYGSEELKDEGGSLLISKHTGIRVVSVYYSETYDNNPQVINKPLLLRLVIRDNGTHQWYENTGEKSNTKWKKIQKHPFYQGNKATDALKKKLNELTCRFYNRHFLDIYEAGSYKCACNNTVNVSKEDIRGVAGYTKYTHSYEAKPNSVRYDNTVLILKDDNIPIPLDDEIIKNLTIHYWDEDTKHRKKPLLMEVAVGFFGNGLVPLANDGEENNKNWSMIKSADGGYLSKLSQTELPLILQGQKCKLFRPAKIDVSACDTREYENVECKNKKCRKDCPKNIKVDKYHLETLKNYTAKAHTYTNGGDNKTFTVTGFTDGPSKTNIPAELPIWDVTGVIVFFLQCPKDPNDKAGKTPLLIYVKSKSGTQETHKWYKNEGGNSWTVEGRLGSNDPQTASRNGLEDILDKIKSTLGLSCPGDIKIVEKQQEEAKTLTQQIQKSQPESLTTPVGSSQGSTGSASQHEGVSKTSGSGIAELVGHIDELLKTVSPLIKLGSDGSALVGLIASNAALRLANTALASESAHAVVAKSDKGEISTSDAGDSVGKNDEGGHLDARTDSHEQTQDNVVQPSVDSPNKSPLDAPQERPNSSEQANTKGDVGKPRVGEDHASTPAAISLDSDSSGSGKSNPDLKIVVGVPTGILVTSALACFAGWKLYNRFKGDPWVRQI
ncbi:hypothetical protein BEWA_015740 [Theileria equi strain WA]|uniref:Uncharacterized protein n=1 Tax=Theileria equi strain WA TaxID=1537102 RepID=L1LCW2_THEEQ|nr:hypothetical protein BEWA_015740 [Theileria equi strain WA]EKX73013.1 hypothetical protein BEWA_015740 [Theileria equi strain WA]|eukprot:XP_004832465.1 hypothetical protein BEWA_015740 [Theileria equi strain WA]